MSTTEIQELTAKIEAMETKRGTDEFNENKLNAWIARLQVVQAEVTSLQQEQELVKEEALSTLAQQIADYDIFGALFPDEDYQSVLGLTTINDKRKTLNELIYTLASELQTTLIGTYDSKLADRDSQIRALSVSNSELEVRVNELNEAYEEAIATIHTLDQQAAEHKSEVEALNNSYNELEKSTSATIAQLTADNASLKDQLERKQEFAAPKPNQKFAEMLEQARNNSSIKSAKDIALAGGSFRGTIKFGSSAEEAQSLSLTPPAIGGSEGTDSFRNEDHSAVVGVSGVQTPEVAGPVESAFRAEETTTDGLELAQSNARREVASEEFVARLEELEKRVAEVEAKLATGAAA